MNALLKSAISCLPVVGLFLTCAASARAEVKAWQGTVTIPTYTWQDDVNPKFWALEGGPKLSTTVRGSIVYPYTMQDHLSRSKVDRTYKALMLENEYLKVTCLPELGGRLHSVLDKTTGQQMFHTNDVIKPGMIAMRGAWISGGVEWNSGPHGHTVTILSPVGARTGRGDGGSAFIEISNLEKIFRTRWTVRVTLHPGKAYLDESIRIYNPTDGMHPYYFWNCTAFPNRPGTRFIYPMSLGTDHDGRKFFNWPVHKGKDLSWLRNYEIYSSVFAVDCDYDFFGAYDVDADRGIVQVADHYVLPGKKAWTWGQWDFGLAAQRNLSDAGDDQAPYIEVQSGPLPTQSDYGWLAPHQQVAWREVWYPVHGLGNGFEYANGQLAVATSRQGGDLKLRLIATGKIPAARCVLSRGNKRLLQKQIDLSPSKPQSVTLPGAGRSPVEVTVKSAAGRPLASFVTPLPIRKFEPPDPAKFAEKPDEELSAEELYLKGRKFDRATNRPQARRYYQNALAKDAGQIAALRALAVLDLEAGLYHPAAARLERALDRDPDDGWSWYFLGVCRLRVDRNQEALRCGYQAARCPETSSVGLDLAGRAHMRLGQTARARGAFVRAADVPGNRDPRALHHVAAALRRLGVPDGHNRARDALRQGPTDAVAWALWALSAWDDVSPLVDKKRDVVGEMREVLGEDEFELLEASLVFAELGMINEAAKVLAIGCVKGVPPTEQGPLPHYYLAYYASLQGDEARANAHLRRAAAVGRDFVFPSRPQTVDVLQYAVQKNPGDAHARLHLGNLLANLGRLDEALPHWEQAAKLKPSLSIAWRNLGVYAGTQGNLSKAQAAYRKAIAARGEDQTLYRDLAEILIADGKRPQAIKLLAAMPLNGMRRADITIMLAQAYFDERRFTETIDLLESTPYFVNWEGQSITWVLFGKAHIERGQARFAKKDFQAALEDFQAALTYPDNLGVGRSNKPEEAPAQYWKGKTLKALGRIQEARAAWKAGAQLGQGSDRQNQHRQLCREALNTAQ